MDGIVTRADVARSLGRRVSKGEFERIFACFVPFEVRVQSVSRGRQTGAARLVAIRHPFSPKARRKCDAFHTINKGKRARYAA